MLFALKTFLQKSLFYFWPAKAGKGRGDKAPFRTPMGHKVVFHSVLLAAYFRTLKTTNALTKESFKVFFFDLIASSSLFLSSGERIRYRVGLFEE
jgi:hypothetical protein